MCIYIYTYVYIYIIYLGKLQRPNPVLPNPGIVVNFREIIPFYGPTIQVSEIFWPLPRSMGMGFTSLVWLPESRRGWKNKAGTKSGNKNSIEQHSFVHRTKLYSFVGQRSDAGVWIKTLVACCSHFTRASRFSSYWWLFPHENVVLTTCDMNKN